MTKLKVISRKNLPPKPPLILSAVLWLVLERLNSPGWVWGMCGALLLIGWVGFFASLWVDEHVDLFDSKEHNCH